MMPLVLIDSSRAMNNAHLKALLVSDEIIVPVGWT